MPIRNFPGRGSAPMESGDRELRVLIEQRPAADAVDETGAPTDAPWTTLQYAWMERNEASGEERFTSGQITTPKVMQWKMGYVPTMDPDLLDVPKLRRLVWQGRIYDITDASLIGRYEGVELLTLSTARGIAQ